MNRHGVHTASDNGYNSNPFMPQPPPREENATWLTRLCRLSVPWREKAGVALDIPPRVRTVIGDEERDLLPRSGQTQHGAMPASDSCTVLCMGLLSCRPGGWPPKDGKSGIRSSRVPQSLWCQLGAHCLDAGTGIERGAGYGR